MALITCPECKGSVSDTIDNCPHCGYKIKPAQKEIESKNVLKEKVNSTQIISLLVWAAVIIGVIIYCSSPSSKDETSPQKEKFIPETGKLYQTKSGYPMAVTAEDLEKGIELSSDKEAFRKFAMTGNIGLTEAGIHVYFEDIKFPNMIKIRPEGETEGFWTVQKAIEPIK